MSKIPVRYSADSLAIQALTWHPSQTPKTDAPAGSDPANLDEVSDKLAKMSTVEEPRTAQLDQNPFEDDDESDDEFDLSEYTEEEIGCVRAESAFVARQLADGLLLDNSCPDKSVRILPGVRRLIDSLPKGRFAVATSGAKTCEWASPSSLFAHI